MMASSQSFSMIQRRMLLSPWPASPVKRELPLWTSAMRLPSGVFALHLAQHIGKKHHLAVTGAGDETKLRVAVMLDDEARVQHAPLAAHALQVGLPALAVWGIRKHEVELVRGEAVLREGGAEDEVFGLIALTLQQEIGLGDGVGLG